MAQRGIREFDAKRMLSRYLNSHQDLSFQYSGNLALVTPKCSLKQLAQDFPWITREKLVVKPDQLFGKRGKHGLVLVNATFEEAEKWIKERMGTTVQVGQTKGELTHFLVEPFVVHRCEHYLAFTSHEEGDLIHFSFNGGVDIEENWNEVVTVDVPLLEKIEKVNMTPILDIVPPKDKHFMKQLLVTLFIFYREMNFGYLEFNPFTIMGYKFFPFDAVARLDDTAAFISGESWGNISFPAPFGQDLSKEESYIKALDEKSGASLKLKILNPAGRVWTMVAGGGASVIYADTVVDLGVGKELANYGEYSGNPSRDETFEYAKTILSLMTKDKCKSGKTLIIGGGIANFTDVAKTFDGLIMALEKFKKKIKEYNIRIFVRRGGPNYVKGLENLRNAGEKLGIPLEVYGPELHMTKVVRLGIDALQTEVK